MIKVDRPMKVCRQQFPGKLPSHHNTTEAKQTGFPRVETLDLLVVGGGIGGMSAAAVAAEAGASVILLDERAQPGGQFCKQPTPVHVCPDRDSVDVQMKMGRQLIERNTKAGVEIITQAEVWAGFPQRNVLAASNGHTRFFCPDRLIVATGGYERGLPLPGWTLPGVMTTGAAQTLLRTYRVIPGKRILIAGNGPFNIQVALELEKAGATIVAVAESAHRPGLQSLTALYDMYRGSRQLLFDGMRYIRDLKRRRIPILYSHHLVSVEQIDSGLLAQLGSSTDENHQPSSSFDVDVICMGYGFLPSNALLRALGCNHHYDQSRKQLIVERSVDFETTVPKVYAVGDCAGLGGAHAAREEGVIAGIHAAESLGHHPKENLLKEKISSRIKLTQHRRFQSGLWRLFSALKPNTDLAKPDTEVCRCESVTLSQIHAAIQFGCSSIGAVKQQTRAGMGRCQGRYCAPILAELLAVESRYPIDENKFFAPRVPIIPVQIGDIPGIPDHR
jgi:NADPH-dependent 2,4-dienoyl-CoA reductase/sulfur reductase-like enzyme